jgi:hypothetical protein
MVKESVMYLRTFQIKTILSIGKWESEMDEDIF